MKKIIAGIIILFFVALITYTGIYFVKVTTANQKIDEIRDIALRAITSEEKEFTDEEAQRVTQLINDIKKIDDGIFGAAVSDNIQKYPEEILSPDFYLMNEMKDNR